MAENPLNPKVGSGGIGKAFLWVIGIVGVIVVLAAISNSGSSDTSSSSTANTQNNDELQVGVIPTTDGLAVTNEENDDMTDCMVGLNGSTGWGFDNPPYQTRVNITLPANKMTSIPYTEITASDGTIFDPTTHAINTVVVYCFKGTSNQRYWIGSATQ